MTATPHSSPESRVELVERVVRRMYDDWPSRASSQALAEQAGVPVGEVIPYERTLEMGADHSGLRRLAESAIAAIPTERQMIAGYLRMRSENLTGGMRGWRASELLEAANAIEAGDHLSPQDGG